MKSLHYAEALLLLPSLSSTLKFIAKMFKPQIEVVIAHLKEQIFFKAIKKITILGFKGLEKKHTLAGYTNHYNLSKDFGAKLTKNLQKFT